MACEYSANLLQTVAIEQPVIFTESPVPCHSGFVFHRDESGVFLLASAVKGWRYCGCMPETLYQVAFHANMQIPTDGTVEAISLAVAIDGDVDPSSIMTVTPAAVEQSFNVGAEVIVAVPAICGCSRVSVRNISTQAVEVTNANLIVTPIGIRGGVR